MFMSTSTSTLQCFFAVERCFVSGLLMRIAPSTIMWGATPVMFVAQDCSPYHHVEAMPSITLLSASECYLRLPWEVLADVVLHFFEPWVSLIFGLKYRSLPLKDAKLSNVTPVIYYRNEFSTTIVFSRIAPSGRALCNLNVSGLFQGCPRW